VNALVPFNHLLSQFQYRVLKLGHYIRERLLFQLAFAVGLTKCINLRLHFRQLSFTCQLVRLPVLKNGVYLFLVVSELTLERLGHQGALFV
jgi:hypothetical protein